MSDSNSGNKKRSHALAARIEQGANSLAEFAKSLNDDEWKTIVKPDGRSVGDIIHHVASVYPVEIELATMLASSQPIAGVTWDVIADMNAKHTVEHGSTSRDETVELLKRNSQIAAEAVRTFSDEQLDGSAIVSLNSDAPLTSQFFIEDHALRHSFHHLAKIKAALGR